MEPVKYVKAINEWLVSKDKRELTPLEQISIIERLLAILELSKEQLLSEFKTEDLLVIIPLEATAKACTIHPDLDTPDKAKIEGGYELAQKKISEARNGL